MGTYGQGSTRASRRARQTVLARAGHRCEIRGPYCTEVATIADHVTNIAALGIPRAAAIDPDTMQAACKPCHNAKTRAERLAGIRAAAQRRRTRRNRVRPHPGD